MLEEQGVLNSSKSQKFAEFLIRAGIFIAVCGISMGLVFFYPTILENIKYAFNRPNPKTPIVIEATAAQKKKAIVPADTEFSIIIPKLGANSKVIPNVDWTDSAKYQLALTQGVAHAEGSAYPGQIGNVFLFSHSSVNFYQADTYNAVFYLANKLEKGDDFTIVHKRTKYKYVVTEKKIVDPSNVEYVNANATNDMTATLMTCWPAGTNLKRLLIIGKLQN